MAGTMKTSTPIHIILDMDSTLLSMECLDTVIEAALSAQLHPDAIAAAMEEVDREMDKGMAGASPLSHTIPARIAIAKRVGAPVTKEHFNLVAQMVPSSLTPGILTALRSIIAKHSVDIEISVVSGGPDVCVQAATTALQEALKDLDSSQEVTITGIGNKILVDENGVFDSANSRINNSKKDVVRALTEASDYVVMLGDGATDIEVFDTGVAGYFIAIGVWVQRPILFDRPENRPYFTKVYADADITAALSMVVEAIQGK